MKNEILKPISFGVGRVSTTKQAQEGDSFEEQRKDIEGHAESKGWRNIEVLQYAISGRTGVNELIQKITDYIKNSPYKIEYCIFKKVDRITRGGPEAFIQIKNALNKYGVELVDAGGIIQPEINTLAKYGVEYPWSKYSPTGSLTLAEASRAKDDVRDSLTRMIGSEIVLVNQGLPVGQAPDGYQNVKRYFEGKKRNTIEAVADRAHFYEKMFELRAKGNLSDQEIVDQINALGFKSRKTIKWSKDKSQQIGTGGNNPLDVKQLQRVVARPVYAGFEYCKWTKFKLVEGKFEGLVSIDMFNRANRGKIFIQKNKDGSFEVLHDYSPIRKTHSRNKHNPEFPFKFVRCDQCGSPFLGSGPRGKSGTHYGAYHCGVARNPKRNHKYLGIPKKDFDLNVIELLQALEFTNEYLEMFEKVLVNKYREREKEVVKSSSNVNRHIADMQTEQALYIEKVCLVDSSVARKAIEERIEKLEIQITQAREQRDVLEIKERDIRAYIRSARYLMEHPHELLIEPDDFEVQGALINLIFDELPKYSEITNGTPKLSLTFNLSEQFKQHKNQMVNLVYPEWNTIEKYILRWKETMRIISPFYPMLSVDEVLA